jgi:hypothetical protein
MGIRRETALTVAEIWSAPLALKAAASFAGMVGSYSTYDPADPASRTPVSHAAPEMEHSNSPANLPFHRRFW